MFGPRKVINDKSDIIFLKKRPIILKLDEGNIIYDEKNETFMIPLDEKSITRINDIEKFIKEYAKNNNLNHKTILQNNKYITLTPLVSTPNEKNKNVLIYEKILGERYNNLIEQDKKYLMMITNKFGLEWTKKYEFKTNECKIIKVDNFELFKKLKYWKSYNDDYEEIKKYNNYYDIQIAVLPSAAIINKIDKTVELKLKVCQILAEGKKVKIIQKMVLDNFEREYNKIFRINDDLNFLE